MVFLAIGPATPAQADTTWWEGWCYEDEGPGQGVDDSDPHAPGEGQSDQNRGESDVESHRRRHEICRRLGVPHEHLRSSRDAIGAVIRLLEGARHVRR